MSEILKSRHGGRRPGAGKKKGTKWPSTLAKEEAREVARQYVTAHLIPILRAQVVHSLGIGHLYTRDKAGKFTRIEHEAEIERLLAEGKEGETFWIFSKDPSPQSAKEMLDRCLDKAKEQEQEIKLTGEVALVERLQAARKRLAGAKT